MSEGRTSNVERPTLNIEGGQAACVHSWFRRGDGNFYCAHCDAAMEAEPVPVGHVAELGLEERDAATGLREMTLDCACGARRLARAYLRDGESLAENKMRLMNAWPDVLGQHLKAESRVAR